MTTLIKVLTFAVLSLAFQCNIDGYKTIKGEGEVSEKEIEISSFNEFSAHNGWDVKLVQANDDRIVVQANENLLKEIKVDEDGELLKISTQSSNNIGKADAKLVTVYFSGNVSKIKASSGVYMYADEKLEFDDLNIKSSSGSSVDLELKTQKLDCSSSSGSKMELNISSTDVIADSSSGSKLEISGKSNSIFGDSSSGSNLTLSGSTENLEVDSSSGSKINAKDLIAISVKASSSSGSSIDVYPMENLDANSSSGGSIKYHHKPSNGISQNTSSGGSVRSN
jgi:hypothetical protein